MKVRAKLGRRRVLRGFLAGSTVSIALPRFDAFLNDHGTAYADGQALPRRFGVWAFANGVHADRWVPRTDGGGDAWALSPQLSPLQAGKPFVTVISGMNLPFGGRPHAAGGAVLMTGAPLGGFSDNNFTVRRPSIDQLVARQVGHKTRLRSIELGVDDSAPPEKGSAFHWWSHNGPDSPNPCSYDCRQIFQRLWGGGAAGPGDPANGASAREHRSVLDAVYEDGQDVARLLGARDRQRMEQHLEGIRAVEVRLALPPGGGCKSPAFPAPNLVGPTRATDYEPLGVQVNRTMAQLLALALSCDITRVFTYQLLKPGSRVGLRSLGFRLYHDITHNEPGDQPMCNAAVQFFMGQLAVLVEALRALPEGAGTVLDNCAILASADCSHPKTHGGDNYPILVVGGGSGKLRTDAHLRFTRGQNACAVPLTLARWAGAQLDSMGEGAGRVTESLAALQS